MFRKIMLLMVFCCAFLLFINTAEAYTKVKICGVTYTQGDDDGICPDFYFPANAGNYKKGVSDPDCQYINITVSNATTASYAGWNLITIPQAVNNYIKKGRLGQIFSDNNVTAIQVLNYSKLAGGDFAAPYNVGSYGNGWTNGVKKIEPGNSYWINSSSEFNITLPYTHQENYTAELLFSGDSGLNMISWFSNRTETIIEALNNTDCEGFVSYVYRWNYTTQAYEVSTNSTNFTTQFSNFTPGIGYWLEIASEVGCNWTYIP
jgi:hypothetical protein